MAGSRNPQAYYAKLQDERLLGFCAECVQVMNRIGYRIQNVDWRVFKSARTYGIAYKKFNTVVLNQALVSEDEAAIKNVILHELAHIAAPADAGHGWQWQNVCESIRRYTGQVITRTNPMSQHSGVAAYRKTKIKFEFECPECGCHVTKFRRTRFVDEYDRVDRDGTPWWWCSRCAREKGKKVMFRRIK